MITDDMSTERKLAVLYNVLRERAMNRWVKGKDLADVLQVNERRIRDLVPLLRRSMRGGTVCSGNHGYMISTDPNDIERSADRLIACGSAQIEEGRRMKQAARTGQLSLVTDVLGRM